MLGHARGSVEGGSGLSSIANVEGLTNLVPRLGLCQNYDDQFRNRNPILTQSSIYSTSIVTSVHRCSKVWIIIVRDIHGLAMLKQ